MEKRKLMKKRIDLSGKKNPFYGKRHSAVWKREERRRKQGTKNPMHGRKHRRSTIQKIRRAARDRIR